MFPSFLQNTVIDSASQYLQDLLPEHKAWEKPVITLDEYVREDGIRVQKVLVPDITDDAFEANEAYAQLQDFAESTYMGTNPVAPMVKDGVISANNATAELTYAALPGLKYWREKLVPSAKALFVLQKLHQDKLLDVEFDVPSRAMLMYSLDSIGIRTRARVMSEMIANHSSTSRRWISLACGAAVPVLDALRHQPEGAHLSLVDIDAEALEFARVLADVEGKVEGVDYDILQRNLVADVVVRDTLVKELGEYSYGMVDALGIFEYFSDASCVKLIRNSVRLLADDGVFVVANMLSDRKYMNVNKYTWGWPTIKPRSEDEMAELCFKAGLRPDQVSFVRPHDGIYIVARITP